MNVKLQKSLLDLDVYTAKTEQQFQSRSLVWFGFWVVELLLITRFLLKLFMPYSDGFLTSALYNSTEYVLIPLTVIFDTSSLPGFSFEWLTLFTILLYWLLITGIFALFNRKRSTLSRMEIARAHSKRKYGY